MQPRSASRGHGSRAERGPVATEACGRRHAGRSRPCASLRRPHDRGQNAGESRSWSELVDLRLLEPLGRRRRAPGRASGSPRRCRTARPRPSDRARVSSVSSAVAKACCRGPGHRSARGWRPRPRRRRGCGWVTRTRLARRRGSGRRARRPRCPRPPACRPPCRRGTIGRAGRVADRARGRLARGAVALGGLVRHDGETIARAADRGHRRQTRHSSLPSELLV